jgi:hypothetical protein
LGEPNLDQTRSIMDAGPTPDKAEGPAIDTNGDGKIDREEFNAGFKQIDANNDGVLSENEISSVSWYKKSDPWVEQKHFKAYSQSQKAIRQPRERVGVSLSPDQNRRWFARLPWTTSCRETDGNAPVCAFRSVPSKRRILSSKGKHPSSTTRSKRFSRAVPSPPSTTPRRRP